MTGSTSLEYRPPETLRAGEGQTYLGLDSAAWTRIAVIVGLFAALYWHNLWRLWQKTNPFYGEANWGHAVIIPCIGLYYLYVHREELAIADRQPFIWGSVFRPWRLWLGGGLAAIGTLAVLSGPNSRLTASVPTMVVTGWQYLGVLGLLVLLLDWSLASLLFGIGVYAWGIYPGQNDYLKDLGMVISIFGIVLLLCGRDVMKVAWFPIAFLICAIPWPGLVYSWVAGPLQKLAADVAVGVLNITGVNALSSGTKIVMPSPNGLSPPRMLNVAEACAGLRSLMTFISIGGAVAFLSARPIWQKLIVTASAVPIAIFCNVMRVSGQGLLDHYVNEKWSESFAHQFVGLLMLVPAFFLILMVGHLLDRIFIEEVEDKDRFGAGAAAQAVQAGAVAALPLRRDSMIGSPLAVNRSSGVAMAARNGVPLNRASTAALSTPRPAGTRPPITRSPVNRAPPTGRPPAAVTPTSAQTPRRPMSRPIGTAQSVVSVDDSKPDVNAIPLPVDAKPIADGKEPS